MDLLSAWRRGENIETLIKQNLMAKYAERGGQINGLLQQVDATTIHNRSMITIGG
jgi:cyclic pyranopterin phosphate synthase